MFEIEMQITNNLEICEGVDKWISYKKKKSEQIQLLIMFLNNCWKTKTVLRHSLIVGQDVQKTISSSEDRAQNLTLFLYHSHNIVSIFCFNTSLQEPTQLSQKTLLLFSQRPQLLVILVSFYVTWFRCSFFSPFQSKRLKLRRFIKWIFHSVDYSIK